jgi:hypothetical protein
MGFVVYISSTIMYLRNPYIWSPFVDGCTTASADIAGNGVRLAAWIQIVVLALIAGVGVFSPNHNAIQEVGAGLLVTHIGLAVALLRPALHQKLSPIDSIFGTTVLDAQNSALSIQLVAKQTLVSRWQTTMVTVGQLASLAVIGVPIDNFTKNGLATEECKCVTVFCGVG